MEDFHTADSKDANTAKLINNFGYPNAVCPVSSHIRKTNLRIEFTGNDGDKRGARARIIRNGIPYGSDYKGNETDESTRGLLFACYQGHIEDGFQHIQKAWSNNPNFPDYGGDNLDPIVGQVEPAAQWVNGEVKTVITDKSNNKQTVRIKEQLVTLKGGDYFFVPSISALSDDLAKI